MAMEVNRRNKNTLPLVLVSAAFVVICAIGFCGEPAEGLMETMKLGGLRGVAHNSAEIESIGRFAVDQHNEMKNSLLKFVRVVNAKEQVVAGKMYHLTLEATDGGVKKKYDAKVWVKPWMNFQKLQEFKQVDASPSDSSSGPGVGHGR